jgi:hypothetical protein
MTKRRKARTAFLSYWSGTYRVIDDETREIVASSMQDDPQPVIRRACNKGYDVRVYGRCLGEPVGSKVYHATV